MRINWKKTLVVAGLAGLAAVPFIANADGFNFSLNIGNDNEAHYRFQDKKVRHNPRMLRAAQLLADAKNQLWYNERDFGGHRSSAIQNINMALDQIRAAENSGRYDRR